MVTSYILLNISPQKKSKFGARLSGKQSELFKLAAQLGGYKTLTEFILYSTQQYADLILERHRQMLADEEDRKFFFKALLHPPEPNAMLKKAMT